MEPAQRIDDRLMVAQQLIYHEADATVASRDDDHLLDWGWLPGYGEQAPQAKERN
jgi:hypothetical protein